MLAQLDQALVVDGRSIWRMLKRKVPDQSADETSASIAYDDLDWDAIQSHPKLAQYRNWDQHSSSNPTALGMLLTSIAKRFEATVQRRHKGGPEPDGPDSPSDPLDDLAKVIDAEDERAPRRTNSHATDIGRVHDQGLDGSSTALSSGSSTASPMKPSFVTLGQVSSFPAT